MPTLVDNLFLYSITEMPKVLLEYRLRLGYGPFIPQSADKEDHPDSVFYSRGPLATFRTAVFLFIIDRLPENQRWLYYWLMLYSRQNFVQEVYLAGHIEALLLWWWPAIAPSRIYWINIAIDSYERTRLADREVFRKEIRKSLMSQGFRLYTTLIILTRQMGRLDPTFWLESVLGPSDSWPIAVFPIAIGIFIVDERESINAFTPMGAEGVVMAATIWTLSKTPYWVQWMAWPIYACPKGKIILVKWALCTLVWMWYGISPQVGYGLFLFINQFPQAEFDLRHQGGSPSTILRWERYGLFCYIVTSIVLKSFKSLLPLAIWPLLIGIGWLKYVRVKKFKYKPLQQRRIRLLRLHPRSISSEIECDLIHVSLDSPPKYTAISYQWDLSKDVKTIQVSEAPFSVSKTIHKLLLAKRQFRHHVLLWIDSICIDQTNAIEKNQQVSLMRRIYEEAYSTIAWLGDRPGSEKAMTAVRRFNEERKIPTDAAGWDEIMELFSNPWFERSWIIQEIAASRNPVVRYGKEEVQWNALMDALYLIIVNGSLSGFPKDILENYYLLNALVIENARICMDNMDYLRLEDILKLGAIFKATLPVDKVFALLGIAEERSHIDFSAGAPNSEYWHAKNLFRELDITVHTRVSLTGTLEGYTNSRRSRRIIAHPNRTRYAKALLKYEAQIKRELLWLAEKNKGSSEKPNVEYNLLRPEYSQHTSPELVYTLVAKTALGRREFSVLSHAGIGLKRSPELEHLPSWAQDWNSGLDGYVLPSYPIAGLDEINDSNGSYAQFSSTTGYEGKDESTGHANFYFHSIRGVTIGKVQHMATLTENPSFPDEGDVIEAAERDFNTQFSNHDMALEIALEFCSSLYETPEATANAFLKTILAKGSDGQVPTSHFDIEDWRLRIAAKLNICSITAALQPEKYPDYWKDHLRDPINLRRLRERLCQKYIFARKLQASPYAKFAHMVQSEIWPSFNRYRWPSDKEQAPGASSDRAIGSQRFTFFDKKQYDLLSIYTKHSDYTLGRKFAIIDSGHMGLVPWGTWEGDIVIRPKNESLCLILRQWDPPVDSHVWKKPEESLIGRPTNPINRTRSTEPLYRLVGQSYIQDWNLTDKRFSNKVEADFKLW